MAPEASRSREGREAEKQIERGETDRLRQGQTKGAERDGPQLKESLIPIFGPQLKRNGGDNSCYLNQRSHPSYAEIVKFSVGCANTYLDFPIAQGDGAALLPPLPNLGSSLGSSRASTHSLNSENILLTNPPAMINEEVPINEDPLDFMEDDVMEDSPALEAYDSHTEELLQGEPYEHN
ncbi:hypothetical protein Cgig2_002968 [Carnegiea gigantea]|uniref:Uncharacterized protein n=1 Tax=Carnegiea gigantea TaxID=171969 RepID=A0A9Q1GGF0_9CARY|nr:hypothetical protein Cgig2_002968 [Carnegiea gigantea]